MELVERLQLDQKVMLEAIDELIDKAKKAIADKELVKAEAYIDAAQIVKNKVYEALDNG